MAKKDKKSDQNDFASIDMAVEVALAAANKKFGGTIHNLVGVTTCPQYETQIPTGSVALDLAVGGYRRLPDGRWQTGLPPRRMVEVFADNSVGKTTLLGHLIGNAQQLYPHLRCAIIDMENALDPSYWVKLGVDWARCDLVQPNTGEEAFEIMQTMLATGGYSIIGFDSIGAIVTGKVVDDDMDKSHMASNARLISQAMLKLQPQLTKPGVSTSLIFTNQVRANLKSMYGGTTTSGGYALKHAMSLRIQMGLGYISGKPPKIEEGEEKIGHTITCEVIKNKVDVPMKTAYVPLIYGEGFDNEISLFDLGLTEGLIKQSGAWFSMGNMQLGQGKAKSVARIKEEKDLAYYLYDNIMTNAMKRKGLNPDGSIMEGEDAKPQVKVSQKEQFSPVDYSDILSRINEEKS